MVHISTVLEVLYARWKASADGPKEFPQYVPKWSASGASEEPDGVVHDAWRHSVVDAVLSSGDGGYPA